MSSSRGHINPLRAAARQRATLLWVAVAQAELVAALFGSRMRSSQRLPLASCLAWQWRSLCFLTTKQGGNALALSSVPLMASAGAAEQSPLLLELSAGPAWGPLACPQQAPPPTALLTAAPSSSQQLSLEVTRGGAHFLPLLRLACFKRQARGESLPTRRPPRRGPAKEHDFSWGSAAGKLLGAALWLPRCLTCSDASAAKGQSAHAAVPLACCHHKQAPPPPAQVSCKKEGWALRHWAPCCAGCVPAAACQLRRASAHSHRLLAMRCSAPHRLWRMRPCRALLRGRCRAGGLPLSAHRGLPLAQRTRWPRGGASRRVRLLTKEVQGKERAMCANATAA